MSDLLGQFGIDQTFYIQFVLFVFLFVILSQVFFKPFLRLFELRHKRTVEDKEAAEKLMLQANEKLDSYRSELAAARKEARADYERLMNETRKKEVQIINEARREAKKISQEMGDQVALVRKQVTQDLEQQASVLADQVSDKILSK